MIPLMDIFCEDEFIEVKRKRRWIWDVLNIAIKAAGNKIEI